MADSQAIADLQKNYVCKEFADISTCFAKLHISLESKLESKLEPVITRLSVVEKKIETIEGAIVYSNDEFKTLHETTIPDIDSKLEGIKHERLKLELWGRKWNVIVRGIKTGLEYESPEATDKKFRCFMFEELKIARERINNMPFQAVHRLPKDKEDRRNIIVRFNSLIDRDHVLESAMKTLRAGSGFSVVPDLPPEISKLRGKLLAERRNLSAEAKKTCKLVYLREFPFVELKYRK